MYPVASIQLDHHDESNVVSSRRGVAHHFWFSQCICVIHDHASTGVAHAIFFYVAPDTVTVRRFVRRVRRTDALFHQYGMTSQNVAEKFPIST